MQRQVDQAQLRGGDLLEAVGVIDHVAATHDVEFFAALQEHLLIVAIIQAANELEWQGWHGRRQGHRGHGDGLLGDRGHLHRRLPAFAREQVARLEGCGFGVFLRQRCLGCYGLAGNDNTCLAVFSRLFEEVPWPPGQHRGGAEKNQPGQAALSVHHDLDR
ncbi:hypothetical protein D3C79_912640 [compost metagenome]